MEKGRPSTRDYWLLLSQCSDQRKVSWSVDLDRNRQQSGKLNQNILMKLKNNVAHLDISIVLFTHRLNYIAILPLYVLVTLYSIFTIATNQVLTNT